VLHHHGKRRHIRCATSEFGGLFHACGIAGGFAKLTDPLDSWNPRQRPILPGFYLKNTWDPTSNRLGWLHRDATNDWAGPGASSARLSIGRRQELSGSSPAAVGAQTVDDTLDPAVVQSWIDTPATNQGFMLVNNVPGEIIRPVATTGRRTCGRSYHHHQWWHAAVNVTVSPSPATVQTAASRHSTAVVTGIRTLQ